MAQEESGRSTPWILLLAGLPIALAIWGLLSRRGKTYDEQKREIRPRSTLGNALMKSLPKSVFFHGQEQFTESVESYWSGRQREIVPATVVRPRSEAEAATAIAVINQKYKICLVNNSDLPAFAIRGGGHSTIPGFSNTDGAVVIDLTLLNSIELAEDLSSVWIGGGTRWGDVSRKLDPLGIAVAGGRNSDVGVGGLTLGGGYSFFSPKVGFVCDTVLQFRVVLASGTVVTASETEHDDLWRSLQGGGNNFGIVTSLQMRAFPCAKIWGGFLYMWASKTPQAIKAFHRSVQAFDESAAGPLICVTYVQAIGLRLLSTHLIYTKPEAWPAFWEEFKGIGRIWSTAKVRSVTSATEELNSVSTSKGRHLHMSTVIKNDLATLEFAYKVFEEKIEEIKHVKGVTWTIVFQPVHSSTMRRGTSNVLGLGDRQDDLVVTLFVVVWENPADDATVSAISKAGLDEIKNFAIEHGTDDSFCYINWCPNHESPLKSYGEENLRLMQDTSKKFDPDGLFIRGCRGGYKLPMKAL